MSDQDEPKVSVGFVNCNRLYYLKSCVESFLESTKDYENKEIIVVDNASVEEGTSEYLDDLQSRGFTVCRREKRDPSNEFALALNTIVEKATGEYLIPLQSDMQFVVKGKWLSEYVRFAKAYEGNVGAITLDAQRKVTHSGNQLSNFATVDGGLLPFLVDFSRPPSSGAADCFYPMSVIKKIYPWETKNSEHEGSDDSETKMLKKIASITQAQSLEWRIVHPMVPVSIAIYTDARGTNARVRGNKRYGDYWPPKKDYRYYEMFDFETFLSEKSTVRDMPFSIEEVTKTVGFDAPIDEFGSWIKSPIRPETATSDDYVILYEEEASNLTDDKYVSEWLND